MAKSYTRGNLAMGWLPVRNRFRQALNASLHALTLYLTRNFAEVMLRFGRRQRSGAAHGRTV
jgi:hypothetical protein